MVDSSLDQAEAAEGVGMMILDLVGTVEDQVAGG